jgi:pyroglutamyl-peptidase
MKRTISGLLVLSMALASFSSLHAEPVEQKPLRLLLTSFDPFGSSTVNNTQDVVKEIARLGATLGDGIEVELCNLPVIYDKASEVAMACIDHVHPDVVVSLGEGGCDIRIETAATNLDSTPGLPDNAGTFHNYTKILRNGPVRSAFAFPVQAMYCAQSSVRVPPVHVSTDPGAFVCNNTAYLLSMKLKERKLPFTFIHVPSNQCEAQQKNPLVVAQIIAKMLKPALAELLRQSTGVPEMPKDLDGARALLNQYQSEQRPACELRFAQDLISVSHNWNSGLSDWIRL